LTKRLRIVGILEAYYFWRCIIWCTALQYYTVTTVIFHHYGVNRHHMLTVGLGSHWPCVRLGGLSTY